MAVTFLGVTAFARSGPEKWRIGSPFELDQLAVDYSGAQTGIDTYLATLHRGDAYSGNANMFLMDWSVDSNKQYPTVALIYLGARYGFLPPRKTQISRNIQSASSNVSSLIFPHYATNPTTVSFYSPTNTITVFDVTSETSEEPDDPALITVDDLITWNLGPAEQPASSMPELADWIVNNVFVQRINETTDSEEVVPGRYWHITKRKMRVLLPWAPT